MRKRLQYHNIGDASVTSQKKEIAKLNRIGKN